MVSVYLDSSAAAKLLVEESESAQIAGHLDALDEETRLVSSALLETELRRLAVREELAQADVSALLSRIDLVEPGRSLFHEAGLLPGGSLRSLDALHLATAMRVDADVVLAYDARLIVSAEELGIDTLSPG